MGGWRGGRVIKNRATTYPSRRVLKGFFFFVMCARTFFLKERVGKAVLNFRIRPTVITRKRVTGARRDIIVITILKEYYFKSNLHDNRVGRRGARSGTVSGSGGRRRRRRRLYFPDFSPNFRSRPRRLPPHTYTRICIVFERGDGTLLYVLPSPLVVVRCFGQPTPGDPKPESARVTGRRLCNSCSRPLKIRPASERLIQGRRYRGANRGSYPKVKKKIF